MVSVSTALSALAVAAIATTGVDAHGTLAKPGLKFTGSAYGGDFSALVPTTALKPVKAGDRFNNYPDANLNADAFGRAFRASNYKSFKEFVLKNQDLSKGRSKNPKTPECGFTDPTSGPVQPLPDQLEWYGGVMNHPGPCEAWCDDELVTPFTENCAKTYPAGKIKYDKAKCVGKNRLTLYWMSTIMEWQVYIDCAKIGGGGAAAGGNAARGKSRSLDFDDLNDAEVPVAEYNATAVADDAERAAAEEDAKAQEETYMAELAAERSQTDEILPESGPEAADVDEILPESGPEESN